MAAALHVETLPLEQLHGDTANARRHDVKNLQAIRDSLARFGQVEPLVVQKATGRVVGGNGRLEVMREMGWPKAQVVRVDLDDVQAAALGITLNRSSELATWDTQALETTLASLEGKWELSELGFDEEELGRLLKDANDMVQAHLAEGGLGEEVAGEGVPTNPEGASGVPAAAVSHVRMVQLFFNEEQAKRFYALADVAQEKLGAEHLSETIMLALEGTFGQQVDAAAS